MGLILAMLRIVVALFTPRAATLQPVLVPTHAPSISAVCGIVPRCVGMARLDVIHWRPPPGCRTVANALPERVASLRQARGRRRPREFRPLDHEHGKHDRLV